MATYTGCSIRQSVKISQASGNRQFAGQFRIIKSALENKVIHIELNYKVVLINWSMHAARTMNLCTVSCDHF